VVAARSVSENFYRQRVTLPHPGRQQLISAQTLGLNPGDSFFLSVGSVDKQGHESLFAYPEIRCDSNSCVTPPRAKMVRDPMLPAGKDPDDD
jgi:hypothetical protein